MLLRSHSRNGITGSNPVRVSVGRVAEDTNFHSHFSFVAFNNTMKLKIKECRRAVLLRLPRRRLQVQVLSIAQAMVVQLVECRKQSLFACCLIYSQNLKSRRFESYLSSQNKKMTTIAQLVRAVVYSCTLMITSLFSNV